MVSVFQMMIAFGSPVLVIMTAMLLRSRERMRLIALVQAENEAGRPIPPETLIALGRRPLSTAQRDLRSGSFLVAMGAGLAILGGLAFVGLASEGVKGAVAVGVIIAAVGAMPLCLGAARVYLSRAAREPID
jgi:hypothetical protein